MTYYIIIRGPLGIGKSTISRELAKILEADYISMDDVLKDNGLDNIEGESIPVENFIKADKIVLTKVRKELANGKVVIFDGCFYHKEQLEDIEKNLDFGCYVFNLKADVDVCISRDCAREKSYGKDAAKAVHEMVSRFDYGINIDTNKKTPEETVKEILGHLPKFV